jgi:ketosteroid isomerase-like protein
MKKLLVLLVLLLGSFQFVNAQDKKVAAVEKSINRLVGAMISGDRAALNESVSDSLSYGHSGGHVEGKEEFVEKLASGKSDFVSINITEQSIRVYGKSAIVRHNLDAQTNDGGKPATVKLKILLVFANENGDWKLLARQAVKPTS